MPLSMFTRWRLLSLFLALAAGAGACVRPVAPPVVITAPKYPDFMFPGLAGPEDPKQAEIVKLHDTGWKWLQAGDLPQAEREFQTALKRSPAFYPSETALGYVELARKNYQPAVDHFDRVLQQQPTYVPALLGRGQTLLADAKESEALAAFEAAFKSDPTLADVGRRIEVLRALQAQENVAAARSAAQAGRLEEAASAYEHAITSSPESAFLFRDLAEVEVKQGKADQALEHYRKAIRLEPSDVQSRLRIGAMLEAKNDIEGALAIYNEVNGLEPSAETERRVAALEARAAFLRMPIEYREIGNVPAITRGDLAALIGVRLEQLLAMVPPQPVVVTDTRNHWASSWINATAASGVMDAYDNHTFGPRETINRSDLAHAVSRMLKIIAARQPRLLKDWQSRQQKMSDVGVSNLNYADASLSVAAGILTLTETGAFQLSRPVSGAEAIDAVDRLQHLLDTSK